MGFGVMCGYALNSVKMLSTLEEELFIIRLPDLPSLEIHP